MYQSGPLRGLAIATILVSFEVTISTIAIMLLPAITAVRTLATTAFPRVPHFI